MTGRVFENFFAIQHEFSSVYLPFSSIFLKKNVNNQTELFNKMLGLKKKKKIIDATSLLIRRAF